MIRPININLNAAHPELKLLETVTYTGSPSSVFIRGIPPNYGRWAITAVFVAASFPDGSTTTRAAVQSANGVWVATLPATATSGRTENGFRVIADGIDENGEAVTGYIIAVADFAVASLDVTPAPEPGETSYQMLYFDEVPSTLRKGDVTKIDGVLKFYNGSAWEPFAAPVTLDDTVTRTSENGVKSSGIWSALWGTASTAFSSLYDWCVAQLAGKASTADATLTPIYSQTPTFSSWQFSTTGGLPIVEPSVGYSSGTWTFYEIGEAVATCEGDWDAISLEFSLYPYVVTATRTRTDIIGYVLGSQSTKPLASEAEAEALRTGKQSALSQTQLANIAAVSDALAFDATHTYVAGDPVVYDGTLYTFTATHTGAWTGNDVSEVDIIATLAGKLGNTGNQTLDGSLTLLGIALTNGTIVYNGSNFSLSPWMGGILALMEHIAPDFSAQSSYEVGQLVVQNFILKRCTTAGTGSAAVFASATVEDALAALRAAIAGKADVSAIPYALVTKTITNGAVSLDDRASNAVTISTTLSPNKLTINFPTATSGKVRDFAMRLNIAAGVTAPEIAWPHGVTLENDGGEVPEIADGGTGGSSTILYFSETENDGTTAKFLVKGETLTAIAQA